MHTRSKIFFLLMLASLLALTGCSYEPASYIGTSAYEHVVIVGIDGGGELFYNGDGLTTEFAAFFSTSDCFIGYDYHCETPSISAQNWGSFLHGASPDKLEVNNLKIGVERFIDKRYPSFFQVVRNADSSCTLASFCSWNPINYGLIEPSAKVYKSTDKRFAIRLELDDEMTDRLCDYLDTTLPKVLFVHLDDTDEAGHDDGYGSVKHMNAIKDDQDYAMRIFEKFDPEKTLFIVTCDHGGTPDGHHGKDSDAEMKILFAIRGKTVNPAGPSSFRPRDLAPIILNALNITIPSTYEGDPHDELFTD